MEPTTILLVDNDLSTQNVLYRLLEDAGYTVLAAGNGVEALDICRQCRRPITLLLTDVTMPGMSGVELANRALPLQPLMRVLIMSGDAANCAPLPDGAAGGWMFLMKPFDQAALMRTVRLALAC